MIPQDIEKRKRLEKYVQQSVQLNHELETLKEDLKEIKAMVKEEIGADYAKTLDLLVKARMEEEKLVEDANKKLEAVEQTKILKGGN